MPRETTTFFPESGAQEASVFQKKAGNKLDSLAKKSFPRRFWPGIQTCLSEDLSLSDNCRIAPLTIGEVIFSIFPQLGHRKTAWSVTSRDGYFADRPHSGQTISMSAITPPKAIESEDPDRPLADGMAFQLQLFLQFEDFLCKAGTSP
jgi:hypothetical protein